MAKDAPKTGANIGNFFLECRVLVSLETFNVFEIFHNLIILILVWAGSEHLIESAKLKN